jgi:hypothetical protein
MVSRLVAAWSVAENGAEPMSTPLRRGQAVVDEREALLAHLGAQRRAVVAIVAGLSPADMARTVVPSGWTPAGMIEHLAGSERYWFSHLLAGSDTPTEPASDPVAAYVAQWAVSDELLATRSLDAPCVLAAPPEHVELARTARTVVLHMIEETARHAGHLDIARELLDGATGLGPR